jgi:hypothetical protein
MLNDAAHVARLLVDNLVEWSVIRCKKTRAPNEPEPSGPRSRFGLRIYAPAPNEPKPSGARSRTGLPIKAPAPNEPKICGPLTIRFTNQSTGAERTQALRPSLTLRVTNHSAGAKGTRACKFGSLAHDCVHRATQKRATGPRNEPNTRRLRVAELWRNR